MTDIETVKQNTDILTDTGKTSPLSDLSTSPSYAQEQDNHNNNNNKDSQRSKSIVSDESSDLSDLDSEAETERMYNGEESQLAKLAKQHDQNEEDSTLQNDHTETNDNDDENDTLIKDGIIDEIQHSKESDSEIDDVDANGEEIGKVVERELKKKNTTDHEATMITNDSKRKLDEDDDQESTKDVLENDDHNGVDSSTKRRKTTASGDDEIDHDDSQSTNNDDNEDQDTTITTAPTTAPESLNTVDKVAESTEEHPEQEPVATATHGEQDEEEDDNDDDGDEDENDAELEEDEEDEGEQELTEEQKAQKQKEAEVEVEKQKQRKQAIQSLTEIEIEFAKLRDCLYEDKMSRFKTELEMCLNGSHPELQTVYSKIDAHREEKLRLASLGQKYKLECIDRKTRSQRTAIHQQFYKNTSDFKNSYLESLLHEWDQVHIDRHNLDMSEFPDYQYRIPEYVDELVDERAQQNQEVSILVGLNQYYGFPTAPKLKTLKGDEIDNDLKNMQGRL